MQQRVMQIKVPNDLSFHDLKLARDPDGNVSFDTHVIERVCEASEIPVELFLESSKDNIGALIVAWYQAHREQGGARHPVAEDLIAEVRAEKAANQPYSQPPGHA